MQMSGHSSLCVCVHVLWGCLSKTTRATGGSCWGSCLARVTPFSYLILSWSWACGHIQVQEDSFQVCHVLKVLPVYFRLFPFKRTSNVAQFLVREMIESMKKTKIKEQGQAQQNAYLHFNRGFGLQHIWAKRWGNFHWFCISFISALEDLMHTDSWKKYQVSALFFQGRSFVMQRCFISQQTVFPCPDPFPLISNKTKNNNLNFLSILNWPFAIIIICLDFAQSGLFSMVVFWLVSWSKIFKLHGFELTSWFWKVVFSFYYFMHDPQSIFIFCLFTYIPIVLNIGYIITKKCSTLTSVYWSYFFISMATGTMHSFLHIDPMLCN